jgi:hypothetical protein
MTLGRGSWDEGGILERTRCLLWSACAELDASGRGMREWMFKDIQRSFILVEDQLEVVVVRGIGDGNRHEIRRSTPKQSHRDAVAVPRRQFRLPTSVWGFKHRRIPSQWTAL